MDVGAGIGFAKWDGIFQASNLQRDWGAAARGLSRRSGLGNGRECGSPDPLGGADLGMSRNPFRAPFRHDPRRAARPHDDGKSRRLQAAARVSAPQAPRWRSTAGRMGGL